jgi:prolyl-tRNA editing enzyme YbaK/EbsC (Cys-tRNA(Pro) deacylase)
VVDVQVRYRVVNIDQRRGDYEVVFIDAGDRHVQVTVSPTGRSIQVYVDGMKWEEASRG